MSLAMRSEASSQRDGSSLVIKTRLTMLAYLLHLCVSALLRTLVHCSHFFTEAEQSLTPVVNLRRADFRMVTLEVGKLQQRGGPHVAAGVGGV
jgi:hypothetical protein